jgi:cobalt-zinc-cadmium efflux system membrane fusion protein
MLFATILLTPTPAIVLAHGGHGNEFQEGSHPGDASAIQVDRATAKRLGLTVEPVFRQRLAFGIKMTGKIETLPNQTAQVTTPVTGTVVKLLVNPGDRVEVGQPVAVMTTPELAELRATALDRRADAIGSVQQAGADLQLAQRNLEQQRTIVAAEIKQAQTEMKFSQERYDKDRELLNNGVIPRRTFLESETKLAEAKAALANATSALEISQAQAQLQRAQSAMEVARSRVSLSDETYQARLRQLGASPNADGTITLTAPIAGVVADRETTQGESGQDAGKKVMTIINSRSVQVSGNVYEKDLDRIQPGQNVRVKPNAMPNRIFSGRINTIGAVVEGETRVVPVKAELDNPDGALKPEMFVEMEVLTDRSPVPVLTIPKSAIVKTNDKKTIVFVQNGTAFQPSEVSLGRESGEFIEVKNGLFDGDRIVTQRANQLYAQSLRGSQSLDDHKESSAPASTPQPAIPWWIVIPVGGAIAAGAFGAGMVWARRGDRKFLPSKDYAANYKSADECNDSEPSLLEQQPKVTSRPHQ